MSSKKSVKESLKNSGLVGGSQVIKIIIGVLKTKVVALLLGPSGIGLIELFTSITLLFQNIFSLGLGFSGVRDVSESFGTRDNKKLSKTVLVLNRWMLISACIGTIFMVIFSKKISLLTFDTEEYWIDISFLSLTIIFANMAASKSALIRGVRNMTDYVRINIFTSILSTLISIPLYFFFREKGIVLALILTSIVIYIITYFYSRKISISKINLSLNKTVLEGLGMVKLGLFTVFTGFISQLSLYFIRVHIGDKLGLDYVGYYAVATTLTVTYMGLIFTAMAADYFPKLSAINKDNKLLNQAVLEQTKIVLLLGSPLVLGMYTFSEYIIITLYSSKFLLAQTLLILMLLGVFLRLIGFPTGYVFLAKGKSKIFVFTQTLWNIVFISSTLIFWNYFDGLTAIGIAFVISYIVGVLTNWFILKKITNFSYDNETIKHIIVFSILIVIYLFLSYYFLGIYFLIAKFVGLIFISFYSFRMLEKLIEVNLYKKVKSIISRKFKK